MIHDDDDNENTQCLVVVKDIKKITAARKSPRNRLNMQGDRYDMKSWSLLVQCWLAAECSIGYKNGC